MRNKKHLAFYNKCLETNQLPKSDGLCSCARAGLISKKLLDLLRPNDEDSLLLRDTGMAYGYWGSGLSINDDNKYKQFTTLRQTLVLFMAAMNNEL